MPTLSRAALGLALAASLVTSLAACGTTGKDSRQSLTPMPDNVPTTPQYGTADDVVRAMAEGGIECEVLRRSEGNPKSGSGLDCVAEVDGVKFENTVHVLNPKMFGRDEVGDSIAAGRRPPYNHTIVAAGNWYMRVLNPDYAPQVAKALRGVVLKPFKNTDVPAYPLPDIPDSPRHKDTNDLADDLGEVAGCRNRETTPTGVVKCDTGSAAAGTTNCAVLTLHKTDAARDKMLRSAIKYKGVPATLVTAGNWTINLCDVSLGAGVAHALDGVVVSYDGN
ncbi:hypothetical protein OG883_00540 [Streptomyces sp. NBC_01142]|uniref:hypothetical protein n=1 Tax=Streptomyces sp. NBC_01142 TaxID=2975865 RepID=UPI00224D38D8|nr:hypothetical protein [Streptomyces sp. NBC_01142]MCX4818418.1 hypothetical protein [Streptomyces sp. NBC_01142]